ncbi:MAG TPA: hypothetical protein VI194_10510 [Mycobacterium sp.]
MQLALRPYATAGVAVLGAGLIYATPVTAPHIEQRAVGLAAAEDFMDLVNPIAGFSILTGAGGSALASVTEALTSGGGALSAEVSDALPSAADLELLDPAFWELFWFELTDPDAGSAAELLLVGAIEQLPVIGPLLVGFGVALFPVILLWRTPGVRFHRLLASTRVPPLPRDWEPACKASTTRRSRG